MLFEFGDGGPVGVTIIELCRRPGVQRHCGAAFCFADATRVEEGEEVVIDPLAKLDGDGHIASVAHSRADDVSEQAPLERDR